MAYKLVCAETGAKCPFEVTTESRPELMEHVAVHARTAHPEMAKTPPSPEMINKLVHQI